MNVRFRDENEPPSPRWITLGQACKLLGVNESTLRRWADAGHVRSFRTPGGHRRFSEEDLRVLMSGQVEKLIRVVLQLRLSRPDLDGAETITSTHLSEAIQYRTLDRQP